MVELTIADILTLLSLFLQMACEQGIGFSYNKGVTVISRL